MIAYSIKFNSKNFNLKDDKSFFNWIELNCTPIRDSSSCIDMFAPDFLRYLKMQPPFEIEIITG